MTPQDTMRLALRALEVATTPLAKDRQEVLAAIAALRSALTQQGEPVAPEQVEAAWRAGWAACRDAEYVGKEAEDEAWGMSQTCANADWENAGAAPAAQPDTRKVIEQMVDALEAVKMLDHSFTSQAQMIAAIQAGQEWLEELK